MFVRRSYADGFDKNNGPWLNAKGNGQYLKSAYPVAFTRTNQDYKVLKKLPGFMNDSTYTNACDPNTL